MSFVDEVFDYTVKNNLTQEEMASHLNITRNYLNQLLNKKHKPSKKITRKFEMLKDKN